MCGIFGFLDKNNSLKQDQADALAQGLAIGAMDRGEDASGYAILVNGNIEIHKKAVPASELYIQSKGSKILVGHTRFATMGDPTADSQAHPFLSKDKSFALTHNGVGTKDYHRLVAKKPYLESDIDSQAMTKYFEVSGLHPVALSDFLNDWKNSSAAIAILRKKTQSLVLFRNDRNPIVLAETTCGVLLYASTDDIIETGCVAADLSVKSISDLPSYERSEFFLDGKVTVERLTGSLKGSIGF